jgi:WD40 repeat protein
MVFGPKGQKVAVEFVTEKSSKVELWDWGGKESPALVLANAQGRMAFSPDGKLLTTSLFNNGHSLRLWDTEAGLPRGNPMRHDGHITCITWSKDSRTLATGSNDHTARIWDATTGEPVTAPLEHPENVHAVGFSPDGKVLATGCYDGWVRLWGTSTGKPLRPMRHDGPVLSVEFSPNGDRIHGWHCPALAGRDGRAFPLAHAPSRDRLRRAFSSGWKATDNGVFGWNRSGLGDSGFWRKGP